MKKGYKAMNSDMTCRGFKFEVGKTYTTSIVEICKQGFHYCENLMDVYNYYPKDANTVIVEIEDNGNTVTEGDKSVTNNLKIVKVLTDKEVIMNGIVSLGQFMISAAYFNRDNVFGGMLTMALTSTLAIASGYSYKDKK